MHDPLSDFPPTSLPPPHSVRDLDACLLADGFASDELLAALIASEEASIAGSVMTGADGRRYALEGAVRVLGILGRDTDPFGYIGRVEPLRALLQRGFVMSAARIALGRVVYAVEYGAICHPIAAPSG